MMEIRIGPDPESCFICTSNHYKELPARLQDLGICICKDMSSDSESQWCGRNGALFKIVKGRIGCRRHGSSLSGSGLGFGSLLV